MSKKVCTIEYFCYNIYRFIDVVYKGFILNTEKINSDYAKRKNN